MRFRVDGCTLDESPRPRLKPERESLERGDANCGDAL